MENSKLVTVDLKTAEKELEKLRKSWKISRLEGESEDPIETGILNAIKSGILIIKDAKGEGFRLTIVQKLDEQIGEHSELIYRFPLASDMMQMDNYKEGQDVKKLGALISSVTKVAQVHDMGIPDFMLAQHIAKYFLGL